MYRRSGRSSRLSDPTRYDFRPVEEAWMGGAEGTILRMVETEVSKPERSREEAREHS